MFAFVSNNRFERSRDNEPFLQLCVFKKKLKTILISSDIRLLELNDEGQRMKIVYVAFWTDYADRETRNKVSNRPGMLPK